MSKRRVKQINNANQKLINCLKGLGIIFTLGATGVAAYKIVDNAYKKVDAKTDALIRHVVNGLDLDYGTTNFDNNTSFLDRLVLQNNKFTFFNVSNNKVEEARRFKKALRNGINVGLIVEPTVNDIGTISMIKELVGNDNINYPVLFDVSKFLQFDNGANYAKELLENLEQEGIYVGLYGTHTDLEYFLNQADYNNVDFSKYYKMLKLNKDIDANLTDDELNIANMFQFNDGTILSKNNIIELTTDNSINNQETHIEQVSNYEKPSINLDVPYLKGVDVSAAKDEVDFNVGNQLVDYYIFKCAGFDDGFYVDKQLERNVRESMNSDKPFGLYYLGTATNPEDAREEVRMVIESLEENGISPKDLDLPLYWDVETENEIGRIKEEDPEYFKEIFGAVVNEISSHGYYPGIYASAWGMWEYYDEFDNCSFWVANPDYNTNADYYSTVFDYDEFFNSDEFEKRTFTDSGPDHVQVSECGNMVIYKNGEEQRFTAPINKYLDVDYCSPKLIEKVREFKEQFNHKKL